MHEAQPRLFPTLPPGGEISPNGVYTRKRLAAILCVSKWTVKRMEEAGELPPSFSLRPGNDKYSERAWTGNALLVHFAKLQRQAIQEHEEAGCAA